MCFEQFVVNCRKAWPMHCVLFMIINGHLHRPCISHMLLMVAGQATAFDIMCINTRAQLVCYT